MVMLGNDNVKSIDLASIAINQFILTIFVLLLEIFLACRVEIKFRDILHALNRLSQRLYVNEAYNNERIIFKYNFGQYM